MKQKKKLTQDHLKSILSYNPDTGIWKWLISPTSNVKVGRIAGCIIKIGGYRQIRIYNKSYRSGRLAFMYMEGYMPENEVDHINRITNDDRWVNLREVNHSCNIRNRSLFTKNRSGITGVSCVNKKWKAQIKVDHKSLFLGTYENKAGAAMARWKSEVKHGWPLCNSLSPSYLYLKNKGLIND